MEEHPPEAVPGRPARADDMAAAPDACAPRASPAPCPPRLQIPAVVVTPSSIDATRDKDGEQQQQPVSIVLTSAAAATTATLVAPRPVRARRHQKSIISLENFFGGAGAPAGSTTAPGSSASASASGSLSASGTSPQLAAARETGGSVDPAAALLRDLEHLQVSKTRGQQQRPRPRPGAAAASSASFSKQHSRVGSAEYGEEIPFPSFGATPASSSSASPPSSTQNATTTSASTTNTTPSTASTLALSPAAGEAAPQRRATHSRSRSRKSSLLDRWDFQSIRLSGRDMVGETDVSLLLPSHYGLALGGDGADGDAPFPFAAPAMDAQQQPVAAAAGGIIKPRPQLAYAKSPAQQVYGDEVTTNNRNSSGAMRLQVQTSDLNLQPMQIYSPTSDAVAELFQIMKHTSLTDQDRLRYQQQLAADGDAPSPADEDMGGDGGYYWQPPAGGYGDGAQQAAPLVYPAMQYGAGAEEASSPDSYWTSLRTGVPGPGRRTHGRAPSMDTEMHDAGSTPLYAGFVPPSPVSRSTRNPIVANDAFQQELELELEMDLGGGDGAAITAAGVPAALGGFPGYVGAAAK